MTDHGSDSLKVLVAEDEPAMLSLVVRHLRSLGLSVVEASEGDAAWELAQVHTPDLVLLDVMMPGMSGWEICKRLKSRASAGEPFESTGVIMLTGIGENLNEITSPLFAADAWLNKPFDFAELDARVRDTLARYGKSLPDSVEDDEPAAERRLVEYDEDDEGEDDEDDEDDEDGEDGDGDDQDEDSPRPAPSRSRSVARKPAKKAPAKKAPKKAAKKAAKKKAPAKAPKKGAKKPVKKAPAKKAPAKASKKAAKQAPAKKKAAKKAPAKKKAAKAPKKAARRASKK